MDSFWKYFIDSDLLQRRDIETMRARQRTRSRSERRRASALEDRIEQLEDELGEMRLFTRALLALLQENDTLDPARVREKILEIDASDGVVDGRLGPTPADAAEGAGSDTAGDADTPPPLPPVRRKRRR